MTRTKPFTLQLIIIGGFLIFLYIFFALATSIYKDYKLESNIEGFQQDIANLAKFATQKPEDVKYFASVQYKDLYAKENLNLLNPGEKLIIIPEEQQVVRLGPQPTVAPRPEAEMVLSLPHPQQWWDYFFGQTLSVEPKALLPTPPPANGIKGEPTQG